MPTLYGDGKLSIELRSGKDLNRPAIISDGKKIQWIDRTRSRLSDPQFVSLTFLLLVYHKDMQNCEYKSVPWFLSCNYYVFQTESEIS